LKVNNQLKNPKGPLRESKRYTTSPTTTEGKASKVFSTPTTSD